MQNFSSIKHGMTKLNDNKFILFAYKVINNEINVAGAISFEDEDRMIRYFSERYSDEENIIKDYKEIENMLTIDGKDQIENCP